MKPKFSLKAATLSIFSELFLQVAHWKTLEVDIWPQKMKTDLSPPGSGHTCRENHGDPVLVPHPPGPGKQRQHPEPQLSLEAGGGGAAAAPGGASWRLGPPGREDPQEHHLHHSPPGGGLPQACTAVTTEHCSSEYSRFVAVFRISAETAGEKSRGLFVKKKEKKTLRSFIENQCCSSQTDIDCTAPGHKYSTRFQIVLKQSETMFPTLWSQ